jgi:DNA-directed RNA polymerase subunit beta'
MQTTVGQILINAALPNRLRDYSRVMDKRGLRDLAERLAAENDPELYREVMKALYAVGHQSAHSSGSSFSIRDLQAPPIVRERVAILKSQIRDLVERDDITDEVRNATIEKLVKTETPKLEKMLMRELDQAGNPFAEQVKSGSRGKLGDLRSMMLGDLMVEDHKGRVIPLPVLKGYASGVDPAEYFAGSYGARRGVISTKFAVQKAGFLGKQLIQAAHREVVTEEDCETDRGIPVEAADPDNEGTVLARSTGEFKRGTVLDPRSMRALGDTSLLVRSPLTCEAKHGVCAKCVGVRERGGFPEVGDNVGVVAAQSLTEPLSQKLLSEKHSGGRAQLDTEAQPLQGFDRINQLVQVPKSFRAGAAIAGEDGTITSVSEAPQGGKIIVVGDTEHYVPKGFDVYVKSGDRVDAGDIMSEGIPNPLELVRHRGIGAGRLDFVDQFRKAYSEQGLKVNRRNVELIARGLINHVRVTDLDGPEGALPDDITEYTAMERSYRPRYGFRVGSPSSAKGRYLERPALHYTIGTRITKRVADNLKQHGVNEVHYHNDPPSFRPQMVRVMETLANSPDWQQRLGGWGLKKGLTEAVHRARTSDVKSVSYIPGLARGKGFGEELKTKGVF